MSKKKTRKQKIADQRKNPEASISKKKNISTANGSSRSSNTLKSFIPILAVLIITAIVFANTLQNKFVNWDDDKNFYENSNITSLNDENFWDNTVQIFTSPVIGNYNPLTIWTFLLEKKFFGLDNHMPWHLNNLLLHLLCVLLVYYIAIKLKLSWKGAAVVALLYGIHPMRVESVAWITERKDVLYAAFYFGSLLLYIKSKQQHKKYIIPIVFLFILSLFSKIQAVILPMSMLCVDYYLDKEFSLKKIWTKWFYFGLSIAVGILGIFMLKSQGSLESASEYSQFQRFFVGSYSYMIYLIKSIVPYRMSPMYPYPNHFPVWFYATMLMLPITLIGLYYAYIREKKAIVFGLLFFIFNVFFLLQIVGAGQGFIADRFTYVAYFGLFFIYGYYFEQWITHPKFKVATYAIFGLAIGAYAFMTINQNAVWKDSGTLWTHVLKYYRNTTLPYGNRANFYRDAGKLQLALADYSETIRLKPNNAKAFNSRARLYFNSSNQADWQKALSDYNSAIAIQHQNEQAVKISTPQSREWHKNTGEYYTNRGAIYAKMGDLQNATRDFDNGVKYNPNHAVAYLNRSIMYNMQGNTAAALGDIEKYLSMKPYNSDLWYEAGVCKRKLRLEAEAIGYFSKAIQYNNSKGIYYQERAKSYLSTGQRPQAEADYKRALQLQNQQFKVDPQLAQQFK